MCIVNLFSNHEADTLKADENQQMKVKNIRLPNQRPVVKQALKRFQEAPQHPDQTTWKDDNQTFMAEKGILLSEVPTPADLAANEWFLALPEREQQALILQRLASPKLTSVELKDGILRQTVKEDGRLSTLMPRGKQWHGDRLITGFESLHAQGFPKKLLLKILELEPSIDDSLLMDLGGNAQTGIVSACLLISISLHLSPTQIEIVKNKQAKDEELDQIDQTLLPSAAKRTCYSP